MPLAILGFGTAVPAATLDQREALVVAESLCCRTPEHATWLPTMYGGTGITKRHICLGREVVRDILGGTRESGSPFLPTGGEDDRGPSTYERMKIFRRVAPELALKATAEALAAAGKLPTEITHLVTVSCTGFSAPGFDIALVTELGLPPDVPRTHVGFMGCHGALNGLRVANAFATADPRACVLLCSVELCSLHYHYGWDPQKIVANALFADGAAALVGVGDAAAPSRAWRVRANGAHLVPEAAAAMTWDVGDHGFVMSLSKKIPEMIGKHLRGWLTSWLGRNGLALSEVATWGIHPGGPKILDAVLGSLDLPANAVWASREVLAEYGNMSSATGLFILKKLQEHGARGPLVALGFGPGLNIEAVLLE